MIFITIFSLTKGFSYYYYIIFYDKL